MAFGNIVNCAIELRVCIFFLGMTLIIKLSLFLLVLFFGYPLFLISIGYNFSSIFSPNFNLLSVDLSVNYHHTKYRLIRYP